MSTLIQKYPIQTRFQPRSWRKTWGSAIAVAVGGLLATSALAVWVVPQQWELSISRPYGLAIDVTGAAYISGYGSASVVRVSPQGQVQSWGSTGQKPMGLVVDAEGQVFVANYGSDSITRITAQGASSEWATTGRNPTGIALGPDRRTVYVTNSRSDTVTRVSPDGRNVTFGATGRMPAGIAVDAQGNVYTADYLSNTVTKISPQGQSKVLGKTGLNPFGLALDLQGNVYTADHGASTVTKISPQGQSTTLAKTGLHPWGIVVARDGTVYTSDYAGNTVTRISPDGRAQVWGPAGAQPMGIALDKQERVHIASHAGQILTRLDVVEPPSPPLKLRVAWAGPGQAALEWEPPASMGTSPVSDYILEQRVVGTASWRTVEAELTGTSHLLKGLEEGRGHEFRISAKSWVGSGGFSESVTLAPPNARLTFAAQPEGPRPTVKTTALPPVAGVNNVGEKRPAAVATVTPTRAQSCASWLAQVIRPGGTNAPEDVNRLIGFLNVHEGEPLLMDGSYDDDDIQAVKRFQLKYRAEILMPWGIAHPTGIVSRTTLDKINALQCGKR